MTFAFPFLKAPSAANSANQLTESVPRQPAVSTLAAIAASNDAAQDAPADAQSRAPTTLWDRRVQRATGLGLNREQAEGVADLLARRDKDLDDRRLCIECRQCRRNGCGSGQVRLTDVLQRCDHFKLLKLEGGSA